MKIRVYYTVNFLRGKRGKTIFFVLCFEGKIFLNLKCIPLLHRRRIPANLHHLTRFWDGIMIAQGFSHLKHACYFILSAVE
jgi:hypothetical protein